jgi:hypothetical protein
MSLGSGSGSTGPSTDPKGKSAQEFEFGTMLEERYPPVLGALSGAPTQQHRAPAFCVVDPMNHRTVRTVVEDVPIIGCLIECAQALCGEIRRAHSALWLTGYCPSGRPAAADRRRYRPVSIPASTRPSGDAELRFSNDHRALSFTASLVCSFSIGLAPPTALRDACA